MKVPISLLALPVSMLLCCPPVTGGLKEGVRLRADGEVIDTDIGHLVPCAVDWNGDGNKDLLVGQFDQGAIRLYLNNGTDRKPELTDKGLVKAGRKPIRLEAG